jgi:hypothetical protein
VPFVPDTFIAIRRRPNDDDLPAREEQAGTGGEESGGWVVGHEFLVESRVLGWAESGRLRI